MVEIKGDNVTNFWFFFNLYPLTLWPWILQLGWEMEMIAAWKLLLNEFTANEYPWCLNQLWCILYFYFFSLYIQVIPCFGYVMVQVLLLIVLWMREKHYFYLIFEVVGSGWVETSKGHIYFTFTVLEIHVLRENF